MEPRVRTAPAVLATLVAGAGLELGDALTFIAMAVRATARPGLSELGVLAALVVPRLVFAALCGHTARRAAAGDPAIAPATVGLLVLLAVQGATGLFLLWGVGATLLGRFVLTAVALVAAVAAVPAMRPAASDLAVDSATESDAPG